jgi:hypothetical protein
MGKKYINKTIDKPKIVSVDTKTVKTGKKTQSNVTTVWSNNSVDQKTLTSQFKEERSFFRWGNALNIIFITLLLFFIFPFFSDDNIVNYDKNDYNYTVENGFPLDSNNNLAIPDYVSLGETGLNSFENSLSLFNTIGSIANTVITFVTDTIFRASPDYMELSDVYLHEDFVFREVGGGYQVYEFEIDLDELIVYAASGGGYSYAKYATFMGLRLWTTESYILTYAELNAYNDIYEWVD